MRDMVQVKRGGPQRLQAPEARIGRSQFDRSCGLKTAFDASYLYPIFCDDVLPGDTMTMSLNGFARIFSPLDAPVMDNIELQTFFFFVPNRLVWDNWAAFQGEHDGAGAQDTDFTVPIMADGTTVDHDSGTAMLDLMAHFGIPDGLQTTQVPISALPFRGYTLIYNEWFRDQNVTSQAGVDTGNGPDASTYNLLRGNKKHDYFTSALPYLQKGTALTVALGGRVSVAHDRVEGGNLGVYTTVATAGFKNLDSDGAQVDASASTEVLANSLYVDLASTLQTVPGFLDVNALRQSVAIQRLLERDARGGTRYVESIKAHFGVTSPDFRLQRPEYLGGGKSFINISPIANTSATATEDQAELRGVGTGVISGHGWAKSFTEHGYVIGIMRARGDITYFQGLDRHWSRSTRYDFYIPALASLGEQAILNKEIWISNASATDNAVFGYQERWSEYRMKQSQVTGKFNPDAATSLSFWHLAEDFASLPALNTAFINDATPMDRITTVGTQPDFLIDLWFNYKCARPLPVRSVPSLIGRF